MTLAQLSRRQLLAGLARRCWSQRERWHSRHATYVLVHGAGLDGIPCVFRARTEPGARRAVSRTPLRVALAPHN